MSQATSTLGVFAQSANQNATPRTAPRGVDSLYIIGLMRQLPPGDRKFVLDWARDAWDAERDRPRPLAAW